MLSIITPAFNEVESLPLLHARIVSTMAEMGEEWEWVIIDDHSRDGTFAVIERLAAADGRVRGLRFSRNSGSHAAIACGLHQVEGDAAVMIAADLQDPPETLVAMVQRWRAGAHIVWAVRRERPGKRTHQGFAAVYYWIMRNVVGMKEMPARGADFFLVDRAVVDAFRRYPERHVSVLALITWLGFRQDQVEYDKQPRTTGRSGWTLSRKIKLVVDSIVSFSDAPIRLCSLSGMVFGVAGLATALAGGILLPGRSAELLLIGGLIVAVGGAQLLAVGVIGEYVWRGLDEARRRPYYVIEAVVGRAEPAKLRQLR
jgi:polyisoprenyl-phosphate glycosyltransferase